MSNPLLSEAQLAQVQGVALRGMVTPVTIKRRNVDEDDVVTYTTVTTVNGWLHSKPTPIQEIDSGSLITVNTYRLYLPIGTNILPGDRVVIGAVEFNVSDTTAESTWPALLAVSLRRRE